MIWWRLEVGILCSSYDGVVLIVHNPTIADKIKVKKIIRDTK